VTCSSNCIPGTKPWHKLNSYGRNANEQPPLIGAYGSPLMQIVQNLMCSSMHFCELLQEYAHIGYAWAVSVQQARLLRGQRLSPQHLDFRRDFRVLPLQMHQTVPLCLQGPGPSRSCRLPTARPTFGKRDLNGWQGAGAPGNPFLPAWP